MTYITSLAGGGLRLTFEVIKAQGVRYETVDGKRRRRQRTFEQTVSPFNKNPDGSVRTREEVRAAVQAEARAWEQSQ